MGKKKTDKAKKLKLKKEPVRTLEEGKLGGVRGGLGPTYVTSNASCVRPTHPCE